MTASQEKVLRALGEAYIKQVEAEQTLRTAKRGVQAALSPAVMAALNACPTTPSMIFNGDTVLTFERVGLLDPPVIKVTMLVPQGGDA